MSDSTSAPKVSGSLADRITSPPAKLAADKPESDKPTDTTSKSWADEVASPTTEKPDAISSLGPAQTDGNVEKLGGSALLPQKEEYEVVVTLADIQGDEANPLHSVQSFEELGMYVLQTTSLQDYRLTL
jgi:hypothetical protein